MIKKFVPYWDKNKRDLENYFRANPQSEYDSYEKLVKQLFRYVINPNAELGQDFSLVIHAIDDGNYSGTLLFLIHRDSYQPEAQDYVMTYVDYGSCSGCDTLLSISKYGSGLPSEEQVSDYMTLCLHLFQHLIYPFKKD